MGSTGGTVINMILPADRELTRGVVSDLKYLKSDWNQTIEDDSLRRASTVLRRLLVYGDLQKAWKVAGFEKEPKIKAVDLNSHLRGVRTKDIKWAFAGGALYAGMQVGALVDSGSKGKGKGKGNIACSLLVNGKNDVGRYPQESEIYKSVGLGKFLFDSSIILEGKIIPRRAVIEYVANKIGGAHIDIRRDESKKKERWFSLLDQLFDMEGSPDSVALSVIEETGNERLVASSLGFVASKKVLYYELLSIGQAISWSEDIELLCERVSNPKH